MCISTLTFRVLINGFPMDFLLASRGLHQGEPISRLLLILVMEELIASHSQFDCQFFYGTFRLYALRNVLPPICG